MLRERTSHAGDMERRAELLATDREERARAAVAAERTRIARELHDVVAHSVSVIAVQAGSLRRRLHHGVAPTEDDLAAIERTARDALGDMRRMLGLLRADGEQADLGPAAGHGRDRPPDRGCA